MTIKNKRVIGKIRQLADVLDTDQVSAVEQAIDALSADLTGSVAQRRLAEVLALAQEIRSSLPADWCTDELYDEAGLPR